MLFWALAILTAILSFVRFKPLTKHIGTTQAIVISALRLLALTIAGLLAAPIFVTSSQTITQPSRVAILVDASQSTNTQVRREVVKQLKRELQPHIGSVSVFEFADDLKFVSPSDLSEQPTGNASHLSEAILKVVGTVKPDELLVISDAQDTDTNPQTQVKALEVLREAKTRLSALLLPTHLPPNLSVSLSPTQSFLFAGEKVSFTVQVKGERLVDGTKVNLRVWDANKLLFQTRLTIVTGMERTTVTLTPQKAGWHRYRFEVSLDSDEVWTADNVAEALVWQAPTKLRVLLVTGQPSFEFKFVKQAIESEPNFEWTAVASLPDGTRYQQGSTDLLPVSFMRLEPFHVLIVLSPTPHEFGNAEGKSAWEFAKNGGGLLVTLSEPTVRTNGWRIFLPLALTISNIPSPAKLTRTESDVLGEKLPDLPLVDSAWSIQPQFKSFQTALQIGGKPVLVWWQEGLGKVAVLGIDGTWRWVMEAARKGNPPSAHRLFWRTLIRFLADPTKGLNRKDDWVRREDLTTPVPPPAELTALPNPDLLLSWVKATGGEVLKPNEFGAWMKGLTWTRKVRVETKQPLSATPLPYLLLLATLIMEWWLVRRSGLQ